MEHSSSKKKETKEQGELCYPFHFHIKTHLKLCACVCVQVKAHSSLFEFKNKHLNTLLPHKSIRHINLSYYRDEKISPTRLLKQER